MVMELLTVDQNSNRQTNEWMSECPTFNIDTVVGLFKYYIITFFGGHISKLYVYMITGEGA